MAMMIVDYILYLRGPKPTKNLLEMIEQDRDLTNFAEALQSSDLGSRLGSDFFTVFAPSDEFIRDDNDDVDFVMRHLVPGFPRRRIDLATGETRLVTLGGGDLVVTKAGARLTVGESEVTRPDIIATNGVLHVIN